MTQKKRTPRPIANPLMGFRAMPNSHKIKISLHYAGMLQRLRDNEGVRDDLISLIKACEYLHVALETSGLFEDASEQAENVSELAFALRDSLIEQEQAKTRTYVIDTDTLADARTLIEAIESLTDMCNVIQLSRWSDKRDQNFRANQLKCLKGQKWHI
jgi:hypothetical protein